jgi:hypothetical protein
MLKAEVTTISVCQDGSMIPVGCVLSTNDGQQFIVTERAALSTLVLRPNTRWGRFLYNFWDRPRMWIKQKFA